MIALTQEKREELIAHGREVIERISDYGDSTYPAKTIKIIEIALASLKAEIFCWPNGCNESIPNALRYLAENDRPSSGNSSFNTEHLYDMARQFEIATSNRFFTAPPVPEIKLPGDHEGTEHTDYHSGKKDGWNECLAEIKHLNGLVE